MPFTFAHPAAAIPLLRPLGRYGALSALIIGSIAPDLAFIVPLDVSRAQTHGAAALLTFCMPAGLLAYLLFQALFKAPLQALLPGPVSDRLAPPSRFPDTWGAVLVSLFCGALTHLAWDACTHPGTPVVLAISLLAAPIGSVGGYPIFGYKLLQHAGTGVGLALLAIWLRTWLARTPVGAHVSVRRVSPRRRWLTIAAIAVMSASVGMWAGLLRCTRIVDLASMQVFAGGFIFAALPACALALTVYCLLWQAGQKHR